MNIIQTIASIATPVGSGGIGVVRISGPTALEVAARVLVPDPSGMSSQTVRHVRLVHPNTRDKIDDAVVTVFRAPKSYTGEDVVEISCHGGLAVLKASLRAVLDAGARLADPGEFTQRAFLNGKIDLAQAEAVNDLIRARTEDASRIALRQLDGDLSARVSTINRSVLGVLAAIEAAVDFPEDVPEPGPDWLRNELTEAQAGVDGLIASFGRGRIYREGLRVVIAGRVNVGKSSLLNALLRHARAIVTPIPGTTRDLIEESVEIQGVPVVAIDTAGLRATDDPVEMIGVELTRQSIESADVILLVVDAREGLHDEDYGMIQQSNGKPVIVVANKSDLSVAPQASSPKPIGMPVVYTSAPNMQGIEELEAAIAEIAAASELRGEAVMVSNARHEQALISASDSLLHALKTLDREEPIDLLSGDLAAARNSLGLITGETASEDLLDRIFGEFCIGK